MPFVEFSFKFDKEQKADLTFVKELVSRFSSVTILGEEGMMYDNNPDVRFDIYKDRVRIVSNIPRNKEVIVRNKE